MYLEKEHCPTPISAVRITCNPGGRRKSAAQASTREASSVASNVAGDRENDSGVLSDDSGDMPLACPVKLSGAFK
jgi:hypothetical protein